MKKIISLDAETNGLWGKAFQIGAVLQNEDGSIVEWVGDCPIEGEVNAWVAENVLPYIEKKNGYKDYDDLLKAFMDWYKANKDDAEIIVHVGTPVEARLFIDAHEKGFIGDWDAPFPLVDVSAVKEIGTSVDSYNKANGLWVPFIGSQHNALYDAYACLVAWNHYNKD